jgi:glycosyltransferase involved in cell wall biosynthesis
VSKLVRKKIAAVIPCFRVKDHILQVFSEIGPEVGRVFVVDDCCPEDTGTHVEMHCNDPRVKVIRNKTNLGVGGAVLTGYSEAIKENCEIIVKIDGDGQMDPKLLPRFVFPIIKGQADYTKGNRFYNLTQVKQMPLLRIVGNIALSFMSKLSTGYWKNFDPTNGYTAIDARVAKVLPFHSISKRYFFETDILFRLNILKAVVLDIPMDEKYEEEKSNLLIKKIFGEFLFKHTKNFFKRIFYNYFLRDMSIASLELLAGTILLTFGMLFGLYRWHRAIIEGQATPLGTLLLAALPVLLGIQFLLAFFAYDISANPTTPIGNLLDTPSIHFYEKN